MAIRITRNNEGNCITFIGSSNPAYWNACLSAELSDDPGRFHIINDIRSANEQSIQYEFFNVTYTDFADADGNGFADAQEAVDYINANANVIGLDGGIDMTGTDINFRLDATSTSILSTTGSQWGVNSVKSVLESNGLISIHSIGEGIPTGSENVNEKKHYRNIEPARVSINGAVVSGGPQDVVNAMNELFTVGAFTQVVIADPYSTMVADVDGTTTTTTMINNGFDPTGDDVYGTSVNNANTNGLLTSEAISQAGEYFTFDIRNEAIYGFGLVHTQDSYDDGYFVGSSYADPSGFGITNNSHAGFQFSHWFHPSPNGSWTNYGANTSYVQGPGWSSWESQNEWLAGDPVKIKVGIDENGFIAISSLQDDDVTWRMHARSAYAVPDGASFNLGIKAGNTTARVYSQPKVHLLAVEVEPPTTLGDQSITVFEDNTGDITGTIAGGISSDISVTNSNDGFVSTETISAAGEYFQFEWSAGDANVGLFSHQDHAVADLQADRTSWGNNDYIYFGARTENNLTLNNIYYENGSHTTLANTGGAGYGRVGFDAQGRATTWYSSDGVTWTAYKRHNQSAPVGTYSFIWVAQAGDAANLDSLTKGTMSFAPTMNFRYIESPDGNYEYPLFATEEEANYYDQNHDGTTGTGTSHTHVYADDPTNTTWYMPDTGRIMNGATPPQDVAHTVFQGQTVTYTEITSLTNADLAPPAFSGLDLTVDEGDALNYQTQPQDTAYTTTITSSPVFPFLVQGGTITGTAPAVSGDTTSNPSDTYTMTVTRTNTYGSSTGTFDITVNNLTAPVVVPINGVTHEGTSTALVDSDTLDDGSVIRLDNPLNDGNRLVIDKAFIDNYVLPAITPGTGVKTVYIGFGKETGGSANWADGVLLTDFELAFGFYSDDSARGANNWRLQVYKQGSAVANVGIGGQTSGLYNYVFVNDGGTIKIAGLLPSYGDATSYVWDGTAMSWDQEVTGLATQNREIYIGTANTAMDLPNPFANVTEVAEPTAPTNATSWAKALDFSGSSERAQMVSSNTANQPIAQPQATTVSSVNAGNTSHAVAARPWACACVFKIDGNSSNQHIWNQGEGAGSTDDNIYLRLDAAQNLYFGWGRDGALNECRIMTAISSAHWYGVYIAFDGRRYQSGGATAGNLYQFFDIRVMSSHDNFATSQDKGTYNDWNQASSTTGGRMDRQLTGSFTIGGRGSNRNFHGKVASMVVTTLRNGVAMPTVAEAEMMITDPMQWMTDYKVGQAYRRTYQNTDSTNWQTYSTSSLWYPANATQVWLMGDGTLDSYSNMIRNRVNPADQNYTKLNLISMVSNDIQNVTIPGLS